MRHHALGLLSLVAVAACAGVLAVPAQATLVRVDVINDAAPVVRIVNPADGSRLVRGAPIVVRVEGEHADSLSVSINGKTTWSGAGNLLGGRWSPSPGTHRLVAVGRRSGAPDAVASSTVEVLEAGSPSGATPAEPPPEGFNLKDLPVGPVARAPKLLGVPGRAGPAASGPALRSPHSGPSAPAPTEPSAAAQHGAPSPVTTLAYAIIGFLSGPDLLAGVAPFSLSLLLIAAGTYVLLRRFTARRVTLGWRRRRRSEDSVTEL